MTRRELVHLLPSAAALPGFSTLFAEWLRAGAAVPHAAHDRKAPPEPPYWTEYKPKFFGQEDFAALQACTEMLIPEDETPGARQAHCAAFIDFLLEASAGAAATQKEWRQALAQLREAGFHAASAEGRATILERISAPERDPTKRDPAYNAYLLIKRENAFAFYTSRAGMIEALDYRGNSYNVSFPACEHPEHHAL